MASSLKVISGKYRGLSFDGDNIVGTRPTMNRVKESLFAMIQDKIKDSVCLDLFAGSGNLGIEAISNGARSCYFVDNNKIAVNTIESNLKKLRINEECIVIKNDYANALREFKDKNIKFDIIFLDPPYELNLISHCLNKISEYNLLNDDGIVVCEFEKENINYKEFNILKERSYGSKNIMILGK